MRLLRIVLVLAAIVVAIATPSLQALYPFGLSAGAFSAQGDSTLRVAGYAFSIWGLLYLGMITYGVYQALPVSRQSQALKNYGWPSIVAIAGCGLWIAAAAFNWVWGTVAIISVSAGALIYAATRDQPNLSRSEAIFVVAPLNALAGWLTIAAIVNAVTSATITGLVTPDLTDAVAFAAILAAGAIAIIVALASRSVVYLAPIVWGLGGVYNAEVERNLGVAAAAAAAGGVLILVALFVLVRRIGKGKASAPWPAAQA